MKENRLSKVFDKLIEIEEKTGVVFEAPVEIGHAYLGNKYTGSLTGKKVGGGQYYSVCCKFILPLNLMPSGDSDSKKDFMDFAASVIE